MPQPPQPAPGDPPGEDSPSGFQFKRLSVFLRRLERLEQAHLARNPMASDPAAGAPLCQSTPSLPAAPAGSPRNPASNPKRDAPVADFLAALGLAMVTLLVVTRFYTGSWAEFCTVLREVLRIH